MNKPSKPQKPEMTEDHREALRALAEMRCWIGQAKSAAKAGAKCETLCGMLSQTDRVLGPRCLCGDYLHDHSPHGLCGRGYGGQQFTPAVEPSI